MKSFHELRKELGEYGMTPAMMKKAGIKNPLKGKGYPYNEMSAKAHYKKYQSKFRVPPIDKNRYPNREREGLEGPYRSRKSGKVFYYDKKAGKYYDTDSDMYLSVNDVMEDVNPEYDEELSKMNIGERFGGDTNIPASPKIKKYIESGKGIILDVPSSLHPTSRFAIYKNPAKGSGQDKVLMATISNPKRGKVKMFSFHGTHVSHQKAMDFAKKHKLVAMKDKDGNPLYAKESVELSEGKTEFAVVAKASGMLIKAFPKEEHARMYIKNQYRQRKNLKGNLGIIEVPKSRAPGNNMKKYGNIEVVKESVELDEYRRQDVYAIVDKKGKVVAANLTKKNAHKEISRHRDGTIVLDPDAKSGDVLKTFAKESVDIDEFELVEDNTAAVAKQVKQAVKKYTKGKLVVRSKGGKTRFIMVMSDNIDNKLRKMMADVMYPKANITDKSNISYGNINDRIISASAVHWAKALGIKEGSLGYKKALRSRKKNPDKEKKMDLRRWSAEKKKRNQKIHSDVQSEDIANTAGSGAVAGLDDKPPVSKAAQKKKQRSGGATGGIPAPKKGDLIPPALEESTDTFAGCRVFEVGDEEYGKALYGRQKYERWNKKFDMSNEKNQMIQTYANRNPGKGIVIKNKKTGDMSYLMNRNY